MLFRKIGNKIRNMNKSLLFITLFYAGFGIVLILSASSISSNLEFGTPYYYMKKQLLVFLLSLGVSLFLILVFNSNAFGITRIIKKLGIYGKVLLIGAALYGVWKIASNFSVNTNNDEVLLSLGSQSIQAAELIKLILIVFLADAYYEWTKKEKHRKYDFLIPIAIAAIPALFVFFSGDKGSALIIGIISAIMFLFVPNVTKSKPFFIFKTLVCFALVSALCVIMFANKIIDLDDPKYGDSYIMKRLNYTDPCNKYEGEGYQVCNGYIAIDNGGLWGVGIPHSTQKYSYLPASHTDFIFPIVVEELGVIISIIIILGFGLIAFLIFKISSQSYNLRNSLICFGVGVFFLVHVFVNLGGVFGIIPLTGIPLPLLSYGGSSCLSMFIGFSMVQIIAIDNKQARKLKAKKLAGV